MPPRERLEVNIRGTTSTKIVASVNCPQSVNHPTGFSIGHTRKRLVSAALQYGMPLYRQATLLRRFGGDISSNTLAASGVRWA